MSHFPDQPTLPSSQPGRPPSGSAKVRVVPSFDARRFDSEFTRDAMLRWGIVIVLMLFIVVGSTPVAEQLLGNLLFNLFVVAIAITWIWMGLQSARVGQQIPHLTALIDPHPEEAEVMLADGLKKWALQPTVRLLLYHRLAMLRHRQRRYDEASAIADKLLHRSLKAAGRIRPHLLLILAESRLQCGDLWGTHHAVLELHRHPLRLVERLQLLTLQTRYEIVSGHDVAALSALPTKVQMAELMPAGQAGAVHALLAIAATRARQQRIADWLNDRSKLLCTPRQLESMRDATHAVSALA